MTYTINGKEFPILGIIRAEGLAFGVPLLDAHMMSDEKEQELAQKGADAS